MKYFLISILIFSRLHAETFIGKATSIDGDFKYTEKHNLVKDVNGKIKSIDTTYYDSNNNEFAVLKSQFEIDSYIPNSEFYDSRFKHKIINTQNEKGELLITEFLNDKENKKTKLQIKENGVANQGFDLFIKDKYLSLPFKGPDKILIYVPSIHDYFSFNVEMKKTESVDEKSFIIKPSSFLISILVDQIELKYKNGQLIQYKGLSNLKDNKNKSVKVKIDYTKEEK